MSQTKRILNHLQKGGTLTALGALQKFSCFRLAARIGEIRDMGHDVHVEMIVLNDKRVAKYSMVAS